MLILITALILTSIALPISYTFFSQTMDDRFAREGVSAVNTISNYIDADEIPGYLENGRDDSYDETEQKLYSFREANPEIRFLYIYKIMSDGCHVVFDLDTPDVPAGRLGDVIPFEEAFSADIETLINGGEIEPVISNGVYGWLYSFYKPLTGTDGTTKAYIAVDIDMRDIISNRYAFIARVFSLLLGASIIIVAFSIWFAQARFTKPLNELTESTDQLVYDNKQDRQIKLEKLKSLKLNTGDEIENIYHAVLRTTEEVSYYLEIIRDNRDDIAAKAKVISQLQDNFIISFADMVENRDQNTGDHIKHTSAYVHAVAVSMKSLGMYTETLTDEYIDNITKSAPLHDIGKIRIPDSILNKPGSLTPEEFEIIKTHTTEGKRILTRVFAGIEGYNYLSEAIGMATYHHEKWDGSGYPEGLSGENIPLCARIMAIADVFDALISRRSYKNSFSFDKALTIISDSSGTHFDPNVVHAFIAASKEICEIPMTEGAAKTAENPSGLTSSLV